MLQLLCTSPEHNLPTSHFSPFPSSISIICSPQSSCLKRKENWDTLTLVLSRQGRGEWRREVNRPRPTGFSKITALRQVGTSNDNPKRAQEHLGMGSCQKGSWTQTILHFQTKLSSFIFLERPGCGAARSEPWPAIP